MRQTLYQERFQMLPGAVTAFSFGVVTEAQFVAMAHSRMLE